MKTKLTGLGLLFFVLNASAQTNNLNIGSSLQTNITPVSTFNAWQVTEMTPAMQTAPCYQNTSFGQAPTPGLQPVPPVDLTNGPQDAYVVPGGALSCFPYNTIYTPRVTVSNVTNYATTFRRRFFICGSTNVQVNFNFDMQCDDYIQTVTLDNATTWTINQYSINPHVFFNHTVTLSPGLHTIDVRTSDWQDPNGQYYTVQGSSMQWNPFAFVASGNITTTPSVLFNYDGPFSCVVPLKLTSFTATKQGSQVNVNWQTASEENVSRFEIEKSTDGSRFTAIGTVMAKGNSASQNNYAFSDNKIESLNTIYYRLKTIDIDNSKSYSPIAIVKMNVTGGNAYISPNPVSDIVNVETNCTQNNKGEIIIAAASGETLKRFAVSFQKGKNVNPINMSVFASGLYLIKINTGQSQTVLKCLKAN